MLTEIQFTFEIIRQMIMHNFSKVFEEKLLGSDMGQ